MRNPLGTTAILFNGADDGQWTLPESVSDARGHLLRVNQLMGDNTSPPDPQDVRARVAADVAVGADVDTTEILAAEAEQIAYRERHQLLNNARQIAETTFLAEMQDKARLIIADHLAPAYQQLMDNLIADLRQTQHVDVHSSPSAVLSQPKPVRDALIRIDTNLPRYGVIREAHSVAVRLCQTESQDIYQAFATIKNTETVWPDLTREGFRPTNPPWPQGDPRAFLTWVAASGAELWLPTPEQQDERFLEVFGARLQRNHNNRMALQGFKETFR